MKKIIHLELTEQEANNFLLFVSRFDFTEIINLTRDRDYELAGSIKKTLDKIISEFNAAGCNYRN